MSAPLFSMKPFHQVLAVAPAVAREVSVPMAAGPAKVCPFGANCSCVFAAPRDGVIDLELTGTSAPSAQAVAEAASWTKRGWRVVESGQSRIVLERRQILGFCSNAMLTVVTAGLWLAYWIPRIRHPRVDTRIISVLGNGETVTSRGVEPARS
jgi:hypothetical protein